MPIPVGAPDGAEREGIMSRSDKMGWVFNQRPAVCSNRRLIGLLAQWFRPLSLKGTVISSQCCPLSPSEYSSALRARDKYWVTAPFQSPCVTRHTDQHMHNITVPNGTGWILNRNSVMWIILASNDQSKGREGVTEANKRQGWGCLEANLVAWY
ncbi:hypothetical protein TREMEDRAFT_64372 [Tremella mesenterica DSM 1558]|uniref:uncharacterized protein n=1 Tax=Tremella mesenterica (strain ATCC 24925 / CBS 8224 / DSM 1558 / NBRC 9311 / NRRL Y-6157 / RJB 2259-6 / UBC 559-6) TaxID=578456 RepID=UPI0003F494AE|nr:uncharacterized protein TREMEDRAFT_64372 [Tremella mesenterica DSM 1558]EIW67778.1 hypothetical protein TREMEDRAFT_64372 [Tremella mesenterica DSM 1558]